MGADEQGVREVHSAWINAVNAGDLGCLLTLMADDAVFLAPGEAPLGREGFSANFLKQPGGGWLLASDAHTLSPVQE